MLHGAAVLLYLGGAVIIRFDTGPESPLRLLVEPGVAVGLVIALLWTLRSRPVWARFSTRLCLVLITLAAALAALETLGRALAVDFRRWEAQYRKLPPFYRKPLDPTPDGFLRRPGGLVWRGQVIRRALQVQGLPDETYRDEPVVTVRYDADGFRNEIVHTEWEIAVAGDSFTELGYLPFADLFTTELGRLTGQRVRNLGLSHTGPVSQIRALRRHGISPATRELVLVFYEGNDFQDLLRERLMRERWQLGQTPGPEYVRQTSLLRALFDCISADHGRDPAVKPHVDAYWEGPAGTVPVTIRDLPPDPEEADAEVFARLESELHHLIQLAREHQARAWLLYMPCKARVLHGHLRFAAQASDRVRAWHPTDLPERVAALCARLGIRFVDLTPALRRHFETHAELPYNRMYDAHLTAAGSRVVARTLAEALRVPVGATAAGP